MADDVKALSSQLAQDPDSLVFLRLGELLRRKRQLDAAHRVALTGLERHPHLADAHDLYARILADKRDYERAFDEWDMARRIAPDHVGALKGLAFLYFKVGDVQQAAVHLEAAQRVAAAGVGGLRGMKRGAGPRRPNRRSRPLPPAPLSSRSTTRKCSSGSRAPKRDCCCSTRRAACWAAPSRIRRGVT